MNMHLGKASCCNRHMDHEHATSLIHCQRCNVLPMAVIRSLGSKCNQAVVHCIESCDWKLMCRGHSAGIEVTAIVDPYTELAAFRLKKHQSGKHASKWQDAAIFPSYTAMLDSKVGAASISAPGFRSSCAQLRASINQHCHWNR